MFTNINKVLSQHTSTDKNQIQDDILAISTNINKMPSQHTFTDGNQVMSTNVRPTGVTEENSKALNIIRIQSIIQKKAKEAV